jgi:hypothetical protein
MSVLISYLILKTALFDERYVCMCIVFFLFFSFEDKIDVKEHVYKNKKQDNINQNIDELFKWLVLL